MHGQSNWITTDDDCDYVLETVCAYNIIFMQINIDKCTSCILLQENHHQHKL